MQYHVVGQVMLVDRNHHLQRCVGQLICHIHNTSVVFIALAGGEHIQPIAYLGQSVGVQVFMVIGYLCFTLCVDYWGL